MQYTLDLSAIAESISKQLQPLEQSVSVEVLKKLLNQSFYGDETTYEFIKSANGRLHRLLINGSEDFDFQKPINIKRTVLLDIIARSLGHENHHAMKSFYEKNTSKLNHEIFEGSEHPLAKLLFNREEIFSFLSRHNIKMGSFGYTGGSKREIRMLLEPYLHSYLGSELQREVNVFFKTLGISTYKNLLLFPIAYIEVDTKPAEEIIKRFKSFFTPLWIEKENGYETIYQDTLVSISYERVFGDDRGFLHVDQYTSDMPWKTVTEALSIALTFGEKVFCIDLIQILLNIPIQQRYGDFFEDENNGQQKQISAHKNESILMQTFKIDSNRKRKYKEVDISKVVDVLYYSEKCHLLKVKGRPTVLYHEWWLNELEELTEKSRKNIGTTYHYVKDTETGQILRDKKGRLLREYSVFEDYVAQSCIGVNFLEEAEWKKMLSYLKEKGITGRYGDID